MLRAMTDPLAPLLERAIALATSAHHGQRDEAGEPYILHPRSST